MEALRVLAVLTAVQLVAARGSGRRVEDRHDSITMRESLRCGLVSERHEVTSSDGYVTTLFRAHSRTNKPDHSVVVQHGFLGNSDKWFQLGNDSLPCMMSHQGYDVWLTNSRGNSYSRKHLKYPTHYDEFWLFSFHEMAVQDMSATIDYVLKVTKSKVVSYVGDSMGGAIGMALLATLPAYNDKINTAIHVSPTCCLPAEKDQVVTFVSYVPHFMERHYVHWTAGELPEFSRENATNGTIASLTRQEGKNGSDVYPYVALTMEVYSEILETEKVDSTSFRTSAHLTQLMRNGGEFSMFDYKYMNRERYGQDKPPNYKIENIRTRQKIIYGLKDKIVYKEDIQALCAKLPEKWRDCHEIKLEPQLRQRDFLTSPLAKKHVYSVILQELDDMRHRSQAGSAANSRGRG